MVPIGHDVFNDYLEFSKRCFAQNLWSRTLNVFPSLLSGGTTIHKEITGSQNASKPFLLVWIAYVIKLKRKTVLLHYLFLLPYPAVNICSYSGQHLYFQDNFFKFEAPNCFKISSMDAPKVPVYSGISSGSHNENLDRIRRRLTDTLRNTQSVCRLIFRNKIFRDVKFILIENVVCVTCILKSSPLCQNGVLVS